MKQPRRQTTPGRNPPASNSGAGIRQGTVSAGDEFTTSRRITMLYKTVVVALAAVLVALAVSSKAHAWGAYHAGYTHFGPNGLYHVGGTEAFGRYGGYPHRGAPHHPRRSPPRRDPPPARRP